MSSTLGAGSCCSSHSWRSSRFCRLSLSRWSAETIKTHSTARNPKTDPRMMAVFLGSGWPADRGCVLKGAVGMGDAVVEPSVIVTYTVCCPGTGEGASSGDGVIAGSSGSPFWPTVSRAVCVMVSLLGAGPTEEGSMVVSDAPFISGCAASYGAGQYLWFFKGEKGATFGRAKTEGAASKSTVSLPSVWQESVALRLLPSSEQEGGGELCDRSACAAADLNVSLDVPGDGVRARNGVGDHRA